MRTGKRVPPDDPDLTAVRPLSAWLSQALVAFIVELDNEFERRMGEAGHPGALLSLVVWSNLIRFLVAGGITVRDLAGQALAPENQIKFELGCLERWEFLSLQTDPADGRPIATRAHLRAGRVLRDGWGSARGIRPEWKVVLTYKGREATEIWPPLLGQIERRWQGRFGDGCIGNLRHALEEVSGQIDIELPQGLPANWTASTDYPPRSSHGGHIPLPVLLSQLLLAFTVEFNRESRTPLMLCANTLRVLGEHPIPVRDIPRLTGGSPETSGIGWQIKPYVMVESDPVASRGKVVRLSALGLKTQQTYGVLTAVIEKRWEARFGKTEIRRLRESLQELFVQREGRSRLSEGLVPAEGTVRGGQHRPALGRHDIGAAARSRMRDLVAQTEMFQRDPFSALPHYPLWDMNRGFGP